MKKKEYGNYEVVRVAHVNPLDTVITALKKRGRKNTHLLSLLELDWPASKDVIERLSYFLTEGVKANDEPVIYPIIETALDQYAEAVFRQDGGKQDDPARLSVFLEAMISETCRALEIQIVNSDDGNSWNLFDGEPLSKWLSQHPGELRVSPCPHKDIPALRELLYQLLTCESIKTVLGRSGYEEAVVAGRLADRH